MLAQCAAAGCFRRIRRISSCAEASDDRTIQDVSKHHARAWRGCVSFLSLSRRCGCHGSIPGNAEYEIKSSTHSGVSSTIANIAAFHVHTFCSRQLPQGHRRFCQPCTQSARSQYSRPRVRNFAPLQNTSIPLSPPIPLPQQRKPANPTLNSNCAVMHLSASDFLFKS